MPIANELHKISGLDAIHELMWIGTADPAATPANDVQPHQWWLDTTGGATLEAGALLKERNAGNTAWTTRADLATALAGKQPLDADLTALAALTSAANKLPRFTGSGTADLLDFSTDGTLASNSDTKIPSEKAVKTYADAAVAAGGIAASLIDALGDLIYGSADNTAARLAGNTTATKKFLRQTGTGSVSAAPAWDTLVETDLPGASLTTLTDGATVTWTVTGKREDMAQLTIAGARTLAISGASAGFRGAIHITESGAGRSLALPSGSIVANGGAGVIALTGSSGGKQKWTVSYDGTNYWWEQGATYT
jgi:hypothetical protein